MRIAYCLICTAEYYITHKKYSLLINKQNEGINFNQKLTRLFYSGLMADGDFTTSHDDFKKQLQHYRLTTAEILYHMPDHPKLLQTYIWQELDLAPRFPVLQRFLTFWEKSLDGKLYRVKVAALDHISSFEWKGIGQEINLS